MRLLIFTICLTITLFSYPLIPEEDPGPFSIDFGIIVIHATNEKEGFDKRIERLRKNLSILNFKGFFLLSAKEVRIELRREASVEIIPEITMDINLLELNEERAKLKIALYRKEKQKPILDTEFSVGRKGTMILGGPRFRGGVLLIPVTAWY